VYVLVGLEVGVRVGVERVGLDVGVRVVGKGGTVGGPVDDIDIGISFGGVVGIGEYSCNTS